MVKGIGNRLFLAPLDRKNIGSVLDIGTGTGICTEAPPTQPHSIRYANQRILVQGAWRWVMNTPTQA